MTVAPEREPAPGGGATHRFALAVGGMSLNAAVRAAVEAEGHGCEAVLCGESGLEADAFVTAAAVLGATFSVRAGPGIAGVAERHPVALARGAVSLDRIAPGRALLGLGRGDPSHLTTALRLDRAASSLAALEDALRICRPLLRGERVDHDGTRSSAHTGPAPARSQPNAPIPLLLAAVGPRTLRLAGALADGALLNYGASPAYVAWAVERIAEGAEAAGRDPAGVDVLGYVLVARTDAADAARQVATVRRAVLEAHADPAHAAALGTPDGGAPATWDDAALRRVAALGTLDECAARLAEYRAAGLRCVVLMPTGMRALVER